jgi:hypothetical protein
MWNAAVAAPLRPLNEETKTMSTADHRPFDFISEEGPRDIRYVGGMPTPFAPGSPLDMINRDTHAPVPAAQMKVQRNAVGAIPPDTAQEIVKSHVGTT